MQEPESVYDDAILREARRAANIGIELVDPEPILNQMYTGRSGPDDGLRGNIKGAVDAGKNFFKGQQQ